VVLEIALAKYWPSCSNIILSYKLQFHGIIPQSKNIAMYHGMGLQSVMLKPGVKNEEIQPSVSLKHLITVLRYAYQFINYSTWHLYRIILFYGTYKWDVSCESYMIIIRHYWVFNRFKLKLFTVPKVAKVDLFNVEHL